MTQITMLTVVGMPGRLVTTEFSFPTATTCRVLLTIGQCVSDRLEGVKCFCYRAGAGVFPMGHATDRFQVAFYVDVVVWLGTVCVFGHELFKVFCYGLMRFGTGVLSVSAEVHHIRGHIFPCHYVDGYVTHAISYGVQHPQLMQLYLSFV